MSETLVQAAVAASITSLLGLIGTIVVTYRTTKSTTINSQADRDENRITNLFNQYESDIQVLRDELNVERQNRGRLEEVVDQLRAEKRKLEDTVAAQARELTTLRERVFILEAHTTDSLADG